MELRPGSELLHYRLIETIGAGGMGVVWKALDTALGREVAIKVLPQPFAAEADRLARFEREARLLASLNHPHIAAVYGLHAAEDVRFLAMELVHGEDLAQRIARGPLAVDDALSVARQVAEALEAAHEQGVVHRDLKPANVVLRPDGEVKVLDFGLAKALSPETASGEASPSMSPTLTSAGTVAGMILGTAAYMSPEQARGRSVDRRADVWALGCLLYEMLNGRRLFDGETVSDTLAAVLRAEVDLDALPQSTPPAVRRLLARCLDRDPLTRLRDAGEARIALTDPHAADHDEVRREAPRRRGWAVALAAAALVLGLLLGRLVLAPTPDVDLPDFVFDVTVADQRIEMGSIAISPDGKHLAFLARGGADTDPLLWVRPLASPDARALPGTRGARHPFWSPDGRELGYFADGQLLRIGLDGSAPRPVSAAPNAVGGSWGADDVIVFGSAGGPISRVSAGGGGEHVAVTQVEAGVEDAHVWPVFLPDGKRFAFLSDAGSDEGHRVHLVDVEGGESKILLKNIRSSLGLDAAGALLLVQQDQLVAYPFDLERGVLTAESFLVADGLFAAGFYHHAPFSLSANGMLAYQRGSGMSEIVRLGLDGRTESRLAEAERYGNPAISPDGARLAFEVYASTDERLVWVHDVARGVRTPVSQRGALADSAAWSADGRTVFFDSNPSGHWEVYRRRADAGSEPELLGAPTEFDVGVLECSPDGRWLLVFAGVGSGNSDLFLYSLEREDGKWTKWLGTEAVEDFASFSPDSRYLAYVSNASGRSEVYVAPLDGGPAAGRWQISASGGHEPRWSPDGRRVYFRSASNRLTAVDVTIADGVVRAAAPVELFPLAIPEVPYVRNLFDVAPDGSGIITTWAVGNIDTAIRVRTDWRAGAR